MAKRLALLVVGLVALVSFSLGRAVAAPPPFGFCLPDLDGHCRYCEIRFAPIGIVCTSH